MIKIIQLSYYSAYFGIVKYLISISLLIVYLVGTMQASWDLVNLSWNDDEFSQEHIHFIDQEITQCHPADYIEDLVGERDGHHSGAKILMAQKLIVVELVSSESWSSDQYNPNTRNTTLYPPDFYQGDFYPSFFHPPKV